MSTSLKTVCRWVQRRVHDVDVLPKMTDSLEWNTLFCQYINCDINPHLLSIAVEIVNMCPYLWLRKYLLDIIVLNNKIYRNRLNSYWWNPRTPILHLNNTKFPLKIVRLHWSSTVVNYFLFLRVYKGWPRESMFYLRHRRRKTRYCCSINFCDFRYTSQIRIEDNFTRIRAPSVPWAVVAMIFFC